MVTWVDADYPPGLRELFDPPPALFVRGRHWAAMLRALRERPTVAIVGARHPPTASRWPGCWVRGSPALVLTS